MSVAMLVVAAWLAGPTEVPLRGRAVVAFSPHAGATRVVLQAIHSARHTIDVEAYSFTSLPIAAALKRAAARQVRVRVVVDRSSIRRGYRAVIALERAGIPIWIDDTVPIAHSKVLIIDRVGVVTGSFNFTYAARNNSENVIWLQKVPAVAQQYLQDFRWRLSVSRAFTLAGRK